MYIYIYIYIYIHIYTHTYIHKMASKERICLDLFACINKFYNNYNYIIIYVVNPYEETY